MQISSGIFTLPDVLTLEECRSHVEFSEKRGYEAATINTVHGVAVREDVRNNARLIVDDADKAAALWERVRADIPAVMRYRAAIELNERLRYYRYDRGERFAHHVDAPFRRDNGEQSLLTFMIYLNDGFGGGETHFSDVAVAPRRGMALVFEHWLRHEGAAVTSGRKYVLRSDVMYGPVGQVRG